MGRIALSIFVFSLVTLGSIRIRAQTPTSSPTPPPYQPQRYDEDWSYLRDPGRRTDPLDRLKYIPLNDCGWYVSLGGEARWRYEYFSQIAFGAGPQDSNGYWLLRYLLHADWHLGKRVRIFTQLQSGIENGRNGGPRLTDDNRLEVHQAFVDLKFGHENNSVILRLGRHEMDLGAGRLISSGEGLNVKRSFDGARLIWKTRKWITNAQVDKLSSVKIGLFNDTPNPALTYWGIGTTRSRPKTPRRRVGLLYWTRSQTRHIRSGRGPRDSSHLRLPQLWTVSTLRLQPRRFPATGKVSCFRHNDQHSGVGLLV